MYPESKGSYMKDYIAKRNGTSFKGYLLATYADIVNVFGEPTSTGDGYKVDVEWVMKTPHGVATIYNYKDGKAYLEAEGLAVEQICEWHVGGKTLESYHWVKKQISDRQIQCIT